MSLLDGCVKESAVADNQIVSYVAKQAQSVAQAAVDLLFPPRCVICKRIERDLCSSCVADFHPVGDSICRICGEPRSVAGLCRRCSANPPVYKSVRSAFLFDGGIRQAIHVLKYGHRRRLAIPLAAAAAEKLPAPEQAAKIAPVPLYPARQAERGYNQARLLANELAKYWGLVCLQEQALRRIRPTGSQVGLDYDARQSNVHHAFSADSSGIDGRIIVLVDDVCTTGATMNACAEALLVAGAVSVTGVTLARATSDR